MQNGDASADIYIAHRGALVSYAASITGERSRAEDVVQEAYLRFCSAAGTKDLDDPVAYLYRVVRNLALDLQRRLTFERRHVFRTADDPEAESIDLEVSAEEAAIAKERLRSVMVALRDLPERTRIALEMYRFGGCTLRQIANHLGLSVSYTQAIVKDGLRHLQRHV